MNKLFKSLLISSSIVLPTTSLISCGSNSETIKTWNLKVKNILSDVPDNSYAVESGYTYNKVDKVDLISAPETIAISDKGVNLLDKVKFISNDRETIVLGSPQLIITSQSSDWTIDKNGTVLDIKQGTEADVTIQLGNVLKQIHLINRAQIINHKVSNFSNLKVTGLQVSTTSVSQVTNDFTINNKTYESINLVYSDTNNDPSKRVNIFANTYLNNNQDDLIKVNGTVNKIAMLFYLDKSFENKLFWPRTAWNLDKFQTTGNIGDIEPYNYPCVDFELQSHLAHEGWNLFVVPRDTTKMNLSQNYLSVIRIIQLNQPDKTVPQGTIHLAGIFESDEDMSLEDLLPLVEKH